MPIKDEIFYGNKGMLGAISFHSLTKDTQTISFEQWMKLLRDHPLVCTSVDTAGDIKIELEQLCSVCNCCDADTTAKVDEFFENIKTVESLGNK